MSTYHVFTSASTTEGLLQWFMQKVSWTDMVHVRSSEGSIKSWSDESYVIASSDRARRDGQEVGYSDEASISWREVKII